MLAQDMPLQISLARNDPLQTTFCCPERCIHYTSDTITRDKACGISATTTVIRRNVLGDNHHVGVIEWPVNRKDTPAVVVKSRTVEMKKTGLYTSPEKFQGSDHEWYEWRICDSQPQLVPLEGACAQAPIATFVTTVTRGTLFGRKESAALLIPPQAETILDDIIVTFIYFESRWREKERSRSRSWDTSLSFGGALSL